jgi:DNA end-binding protein Ku
VPRPRRKSQRGRPGTKSDAEGADASAVARGVWSGSITFGLVTIPVELYSTSRRAAGAMRLLGPDGIPLARQSVCPADGRVLSEGEIERGYELEDGKFVRVTDAELAALAPRRSRDIELTRFVDRDAIDAVYFVRTYFVLPAGDQTKAYRLLAETMEATGRAALADFVMRGKAYAVALFADRGLLRAQTLRFNDELRKPEEMGIPAPEGSDAARVLKMKGAIAKSQAKQIDESELTDDAATRLLELARKKLARGVDVVRAPKLPEDESEAESESESNGEVIDLLALIRKRLRESPATRSPGQKKTGSKPSIRKVPSRRVAQAMKRREA